VSNLQVAGQQMTAAPGQALNWYAINIGHIGASGRTQKTED